MVSFFTLIYHMWEGATKPSKNILPPTPKLMDQQLQFLCRKCWMELLFFKWRATSFTMKKIVLNEVLADSNLYKCILIISKIFSSRTTGPIQTKLWVRESIFLNEFFKSHLEIFLEEMINCWCMTLQAQSIVNNTLY